MRQTCVNACSPANPSMSNNITSGENLKQNGLFQEDGQILISLFY